ERYNGSQWSTVAPPSGISVRGLDVVSSTNVWVAGYSGSTGTISQWTGSGWVPRYTLPPIPGRHLAVFEGIAVGPNGDVWAVGWDRDYNAPGRATAALIVHRDSQGNWSRETAKNVATRDTLMDATVLPNGEVFAAGVAQNVSSGITSQALLLHRTGS